MIKGFQMAGSGTLTNKKMLQGQGRYPCYPDAGQCFRCGLSIS